MIRFLAAFILFCCAPTLAMACDAPVSVCEKDSSGSVRLIVGYAPAAVYVDSGADAGVLRVARSFADDLERVSGQRADVIHDLSKAKGHVVIIAQLGKSPVVDGWIAEGKLTAPAIAGQWEAYVQTVVENPAPGIDRAVVIIGSDKRGAIFGTYDLSAKIGVSPWYWWADVPVERKASVYVTAGTATDKPVVKYRGIFINDEEPAFGNWSREKFGGINSKMYENMFELILRLKGNYLWPAMWGKAFNDDDPRNYVLADEMGVVMSTSHHEPMMRAQDEWHRNKEGGITGGKWDYTANAENLRTFWKGGIERLMKPDGSIYESVVTIGMRGDGDEPMTEDTATTLLETIVADQRQIITDVTGRPAEKTPQVWALYKEVQDYYEQGMQVPDDVILLFADDNWGQIRRLPARDKRDRAGGYGVYYHFDYVGGPRNYKWLNTNQIQKVWQQMDLAYRAGVETLWIVNVGDLKPMEYPISFFLDMAWNPPAMTLEALEAYPQKWAAQQFGAEPSEEIGSLLTRYATIGSRRTPELTDASTFDIGTPEDWKRGGGEWRERWLELNTLERDTQAIGRKLPAAYQDAYFQLVLHPTAALNTLYNLYYGVALNHAAHKAGDQKLAEAAAARAVAMYQRDAELSAQYHSIKGGKWNHMMSQVRIGYTYWQQPEKQTMPELATVPAEKPYRLETKAPEAPAMYRAIASRGVYQERDGAIAIEAERFSRKFDGQGHTWRAIPHLGRTLSAITTFPQGQVATTAEDGIRLEYDLALSATKDIVVHLDMIPTLDVWAEGGVKIGVSLDDGPVQILSFDMEPHSPQWDKAVSDKTVRLNASFPGVASGNHTLKVFRISDNAVLQRIVIDAGGLKSSYLGPVESSVR